MNIFNKLFASLMMGGASCYYNNRKPYNHNDKTPYDVQVQYKTLVGMPVYYGNRLYIMLVPKRLHKLYMDAKRKAIKGKELTPMEKTRLYGYLNPAYHAACESRKRR